MEIADSILSLKLPGEKVGGRIILFQKRKIFYKGREGLP